MGRIGRRLYRIALVFLVAVVTLAAWGVTATAPGVHLIAANEPEAPALVRAVTAVAEPVPPPVVAGAPQEPPLRPPVNPGERSGQIPVLMYHEIGDVVNNNYLRRSEFEAQMQWLAENGYNPVTLSQVYRHINDFRPLPAKPVVITFDDGYSTFYTVAVPILRKHRFTATVFVATGLLERPEHMTWSQVAELPTLGIELGSHTVTHADLRFLSGARLTREVAESKKQLEARTGARIEFFCYPGGKYNGETPEAVKAAGYLGAVTTEYGPVTPEQSPFLWSRVRILRGETGASFARKIRAASGERS